jgi:diguanylate cyclase (GGDEF)-like protein
MEELAMVDELTGLLNRRTLMARLEAEWSRSQRYRRSLALVLLDVDHFKQVNDLHGHGTGDSALLALARVIQRATRHVDTVGRLGGDEFLLILPETGASGALEVANRLGRSTDTLSIASQDTGMVSFTTSLGIAVWPETPAASAAQLLLAADQALYRAKAAGRHRVEF